MAPSDDQGGKLDRTDELAPTAMLAGKYRLGRLLGEGGMGSVYEAEHVGLGAKVAVKLLGDGSSSDPKSVARFKREARAMGQIKHDNVVRVMDTGADDFGLPYLVMELLDGESLSSVLRREKVLKPHVAVEIAIQLLAGLQVAHDKGVVHRDLKPGNVFIANQQDGTRRVKILDFGISKLSDSTTHNVTAEGALVGTPNFMAPEQITGESDNDTRIDVYAVGVLLYRMVAGRLPYVSRQADELYKKILAAKPTPPRQLQPDVPPELEGIILKAMAPSRERRFRDARSFEIALRELYPTHEVFAAALPSGGLHQLTTLPRGPSPGRVSDAATVAAGPRARRSHGGAGGRRFVPWIAGAVLLALAAGGAAWYHGVHTGARGEALRFGITRYEPTRLIQKALSPLNRYLEDRLGRPVELVVVDDYEDLADKVLAGKVDFAALSAVTYVRAHERDLGLVPVATPVRRGGNTNYEGYILVRANSDINSLEDLRGKVFCYVNPTSTSGYLFPRALFRKKGFDPDRMFSATRFGGDHLATLSALYNGACDGAVVYASMWLNGGKQGMPPQAFRVIDTTDRMPDDAYVIAHTVGADEAERIRQSLLALAPGSALAKRVLIDPAVDSRQDIVGFKAVDDSQYELVRRYRADEQARRHSDRPGGQADGGALEPAPHPTE